VDCWENPQVIAPLRQRRRARILAAGGTLTIFFAGVYLAATKPPTPSLLKLRVAGDSGLTFEDGGLLDALAYLAPVEYSSVTFMNAGATECGRLGVPDDAGQVFVSDWSCDAGALGRPFRDYWWVEVLWRTDRCIPVDGGRLCQTLPPTFP
jgi:hypothetical protein